MVFYRNRFHSFVVYLLLLRFPVGFLGFPARFLKRKASENKKVRLDLQVKLNLLRFLLTFRTFVTLKAGLNVDFDVERILRAILFKILEFEQKIGCVQVVEVICQIRQAIFRNIVW